MQETVGAGGTGGEICGDTICATLVALNKAPALFRVSRSLTLIRQESCRPRGQGEIAFQPRNWKSLFLSSILFRRDLD